MRTSVRRALLQIPIGLLFATMMATVAQAQTWVSTGDMTAARWIPAVVQLDDGRVLVVNREQAGIQPADFYDPQTRSFSPAPTPTQSHPSAQVVKLRDGRVLVAGGRDGASLANAELFDPATNTWTATGSLNQARIGHTLSLLPNGTVLAAGGHGAGFLASAEIFDPATGRWTLTGSMAVGRWLHTATTLDDGRILVAAGENYGYCQTSCNITSAEIFNPATGLWSTTGSLGQARANHNATLLQDGRVLVSGGSVSTAEVYDTTSGQWATVGSPIVPRFYGQLVTLLSGDVLMIGGHITSTALDLASTELFDPTTNAWTAGPTMNSPRYAPGVALLTDGTVLVCGGKFGSTYLASAETFGEAPGQKMTAVVTMGALTQTFTGSALAPTATTVPEGLSLVWTGVPQVAAGSYAVTATVVDLNYTGTANGTFTILTARESATNLTTVVSSLPVPPSVTGELLASLQAAVAAFDRGNQTAGINQMQAFQNKVRAQSGKKIDQATADALIAAAQRTINAARGR